MANVQITQLPAANPLTGTELVPIVQDGITVRSTTGDIAAATGPLLNTDFVLLSYDPTLPNSRYLSSLPPIKVTDNGALSNVVVSLDTSGVTAGTYTNANITVDDKGIITSASSGVAQGITLLNTGLGLSGGPITTIGTIAVDPAVTALLSYTQTLTNKTIDGNNNTLLNIANSALVNSSITINGTPVSLGGSIITPSGTVTSVTGTAPIASTGGNTPAISISMANTTTDGYLSSTDWNTFNNKGYGTVTSVTGTAPISVATGTTTPVISMSTATTSTSGYLTSTDWNTFNNKQTAYTNLSTIGGLTNGVGWLYNNGTGTFSYSVPTASDVGAVPTTRTLTVNGTTYDLTANRTWSVGTVTSVAALTLGTTGTDLSSTVANSTTTPVITLNVPTASATNRGALSSTDWSTFNGKQTAYTNLSTIGALANSAGWLYNNGSGTFSYSTPTKTDVGLGNVTNDAQTKAAIVPNTIPTAGQILVGNAGGTAYAPVSMSNDITLASTGAATLATVNSNVGSFTYASLTVNAKGLVTAASSGTAPVTSVTGTAPVVSSGGTTPAISMPAATASVNGYLTSTDWSTFNSKAPATSGTSILYGNGSGGFSNVTIGTNLTFVGGTLSATGGSGSGTVTSVSGTGTVSGISLSGTVTSSGSLTLGGTLDLSSPPTIGNTTPNTIAGTNISSATAPTNTVPALALTGTPNSAAGGKTGVLGIGTNFTASDKNILASFVQNINDYTQVVVQNPNAGASASADFVVNNDNTTGTGTYGDFGINSSAFSGTGSLGLPNATYLYSVNGDISIGTTTSNAIHFVINSGATDAMSISTAGVVSLGTPLALTSGGTGKTTAPAAMANIMGFTSTATSGITTTLTNTSSYYQIFTGTSTQTITLPVTSTLQTGWSFHIVNNSTGNLTVNSSGGNLVITVIPGVTAMVTCIGTTLTTAADWESGFTDFSTATGTGNVVLATSPTLTTPAITGGTIDNSVIGGSTPAAITGTTITDSIGNVRTIVQNPQSGATSYTLVSTDAGKHIYVTGTGGVTMPVSVFTAGQAITIVNNTAASITITAPSAGTMYLAGTATTGNRTLAQRGMMTVLYVVGGATPTVIASGSGLT